MKHKIYPAVDILDGQAVRLYKGDYQQAKTYGDPLQMALKWQRLGADGIHLVDLNGARDGYLVNRESLLEIIETVHIPVQVGGGLRDIASIREILATSATRVVLGTAAVKQPQLVTEIIKEFNADRIAVSVDVKNERLQLSGWKEGSSSGIEQLRKLCSQGVKAFICTSVQRDGTLSGIDTQLLLEVASQLETGNELTYAGGVSGLGDLKALQSMAPALDINLSVIIGTALYEKKLTLSDAKKALNG